MYAAGHRSMREMIARLFYPYAAEQRHYGSMTPTATMYPLHFICVNLLQPLTAVVLALVTASATVQTFRMGSKTR
jgi:hypothetical protein